MLVSVWATNGNHNFCKMRVHILLQDSFKHKYTHLLFQLFYFLSYFYFFGYYRSLIRFFDSRDSIFLCVSGSLLYLDFHGQQLCMSYNLSSIANRYTLNNCASRTCFLSAVLYAFINISRDVAKYFLYPYQN